MPKNKDLSPPNLNDIATWPTSFKPFIDKDYPIYWIPGQYYNPTTSQYDFVEAELPRNPTLHIPKMGRFLHTYPDDKDLSEEWDDAEIDEPTPAGTVALHLWQWSQRRFPDDPLTEDILDYFECEVLGLVPTFQDGLNRIYVGPGVCGGTVVVKKNGSIVDSKAVTGFTSWTPPGFGPYAQVTVSC